MDNDGERTRKRERRELTGSRKYPEHVLLINSGGLLTAASFANEFALALALAFTLAPVLAAPTEVVVNGVNGVKGVMGCNPPMPPRAGARSAASFGCAFSCAARSIGDMKYEAEPEPELELELEPERRSVRAAFVSVGLALALALVLAEPFASFASAPLSSASPPASRSLCSTSPPPSIPSSSSSSSSSSAIALESSTATPSGIVAPTRPLGDTSFASRLPLRAPRDGRRDKLTGDSGLEDADEPEKRRSGKGSGIGSPFSVASAIGLSPPAPAEPRLDIDASGVNAGRIASCAVLDARRDAAGEKAKTDAGVPGPTCPWSSMCSRAASSWRHILQRMRLRGPPLLWPPGVAGAESDGERGNLANMLSFGIEPSPSVCAVSESSGDVEERGDGKRTDDLVERALEVVHAHGLVPARDLVRCAVEDVELFEEAVVWSVSERFSSIERWVEKKGRTVRSGAPARWSATPPPRRSPSRT